MKENSYSHKLRYDGYLKLIYRCLSDDIYIELILYRKIICVNKKIHVTGSLIK